MGWLILIMSGYACILALCQKGWITLRCYYKRQNITFSRNHKRDQPFESGFMVQAGEENE
jgi:hypothetical protein